MTRHDFGMLIARAICPDSWDEYIAGKGTCASMDGWKVVESVEATGRIIKALEENGFSVPVRDPDHVPPPLFPRE